MYRLGGRAPLWHKVKSLVRLSAWLVTVGWPSPSQANSIRFVSKVLLGRILYVVGMCEEAKRLSAKPVSNPCYLLCR